MKEYNKDGQRTYILYQEKVEVEVFATQLSPVGVFVSYHLMGYKPTYKDTCQETYRGQENLTCDEIKPIKKRTTKKHQ